LPKFGLKIGLVDVVISLLAREGLDTIDRFSLERISCDTADSYGDGIEEPLVRLETYAEPGAPYLDVAPPLRAIPYRRHRPHYDYDGGTVTIVRSLHPSADAPATLASKSRIFPLPKWGIEAEQANRCSRREGRKNDAGPCEPENCVTTPRKGLSSSCTNDSCQPRHRHESA
jgi:plasmid stabilization system protein ParE